VVFIAVVWVDCEICIKAAKRRHKTEQLEAEIITRECRHPVLIAPGETAQQQEQYWKERQKDFFPSPLPTHTTANNVNGLLHERASAAIHVQRHKCQSVCWKYWKRYRQQFPHMAKTCRFGFPALLTEAAVSEAGAITISRASHSINNYNEALLGCFGFNHDVNHLWGTAVATQAAVRYAVDYSTKQQQTLLRKFPILKAALEKFNARLSSGFYADRTKSQLSRSFLMTLQNHLLASAELSQATVVNHLLGLPARLCPDRFCTLYLSPFLEMAEQSDKIRNFWAPSYVSTNLKGLSVAIDAKGAFKSQILDFTNLHPGLKASFCLYDFVSFIEIRKIKQERTLLDDKDDGLRYRLAFDHPNYGTHAAKILHPSEAFVPIYRGPTIPSCNCPFIVADLICVF
jgi:hypothetical protein